MSEQQIQNQIRLQLDALKETTENALKSKEAAYEYLISAGIIDVEKDSKFEVEINKNWLPTDQHK